MEAIKLHEVMLLLVLAILAATTAIYIAFTKHLLRAVFALLLCFLVLAVLYIWLAAELVGVAQLVIYIGGTLVLLLFAVLLTRQYPLFELSPFYSYKKVLAGWLLAALLLILFVYAIAEVDLVYSQATHQVSIQALGAYMLTHQLLVFELAGLLLTFALVGALFVLKRALQRQD